MKSHFHRVARGTYAQAIVAVSVGICALVAAAATESSPKQEERLPSIEKLRSEEPPVRDAGVDAILANRVTVVKQLIPLIDPANATRYSDQTRCAGAYVLGELRAEEALPVLSRALADEPGRKMWSRPSRYDAPVWNALVKIGRPAVPAMIENLETSDDTRLQRKSLDVLNHVLGGKRRLMELLAKLEKRTEDKETRRRIGECITWSRDHYKESAEPLY